MRVGSNQESVVSLNTSRLMTNTDIFSGLFGSVLFSLVQTVFLMHEKLSKNFLEHYEVYELILFLDIITSSRGNQLSYVDAS